LLTPEDHLALVSTDAARQVSLAEQGKIASFAWSPDGRWLAFLTSGGRLTLASIERSQSVVVSERAGLCGVTWSDDSSHLAYLHDITDTRQSYGVEVCLFDLASGQTTTLATYPRPGAGAEIAALCDQTFPAAWPVVVEKVGGSLHVWDARTSKLIVSLDSVGAYSSLLRSVGACAHLWLPGAKGILFPKPETTKKGIQIAGAMAGPIYPVSLALWTAGSSSGPTTLLEAQERQSIWPVRWLPDGRLEVLMTQWDKDEYDTPAKPEHLEYRYYQPSEHGELFAVNDGDLLWWMGGGLQQRLSQAGLQPAQGELGHWGAASDGETVAFSWVWQADGREQGAVYLWRGEGEPVHLAMGHDPQWQPGQGQP